MNKAWSRVKLGDVRSLDLDKIAISSSQQYLMIGALSFGQGLFDRKMD